MLSYQYFITPTLKLLRNNISKRYFRLAIPVLASCVLVWALHKGNLFSKEYIPITDSNRDWLARLFPDNLNFFETLKYGLYDSFAGKSDYNAVLWTMHTELLGSFLLFIFLLVTHKIERKTKLFLAIIFIQFIIGDTHYKAFSFGMFICYLQHNNHSYKRIVSLPVVKVGLVLLGLYLASFPYVSYDNSLQQTMYRFTLIFRTKNYYELANVFGCSFLLIVFVNSSKLKVFFTTKPFLFLGKISFGLYLLHLCLIPVVSSYTYNFLHRYFFDCASIPITFVVSLSCVVSVSYLFYKYIDAFAVRNASKISRFLFRYS